MSGIRVGKERTGLYPAPWLEEGHRPLYGNSNILPVRSMLELHVCACVRVCVCSVLIRVK